MSGPLWRGAPPASAQEAEGAQPGAVTDEQISGEDLEVIENIEILENLDLFLEEDIEMINNLDLLLANS